MGGANRDSSAQLLSKTRPACLLLRVRHRHGMQQPCCTANTVLCGQLLHRLLGWTGRCCAAGMAAIERGLAVDGSTIAESESCSTPRLVVARQAGRRRQLGQPAEQSDAEQRQASSQPVRARADAANATPGDETDTDQEDVIDQLADPQIQIIRPSNVRDAMTESTAGKESAAQSWCSACVWSERERQISVVRCERDETRPASASASADQSAGRGNVRDQRVEERACWPHALAGKWGLAWKQGRLVGIASRK